MSTAPIYVGTAGWSVPREHAAHFTEQGSHLERYAQVLPAVEINTSFYRLHMPQTYARWSASVPEGFRFSVKVPRQITHNQRLKSIEGFSPFLEGVRSLGEKLGLLLVQLPPSLVFDNDVASDFFAALRSRFTGLVVCEPRHPTWFTSEAESLLESYQVARVAADPAVVPDAAKPGGWQEAVYYRLHGSPKMYYSRYSTEQIDTYADRLEKAAMDAEEVWCIFDNTAEFHATENALYLLERLF